MPKIRAPKSQNILYKILNTLFFFLRMSSFGAEPERSYIFFANGCEAANALKVFLNSVISS